MKFLLSTCAILCVAVCSAAAHADTIDNFYLSSTLTMGYTAQGTVTIDITTGVVDTSDFTVSKGGVVDATFTNTSFDGLYAGYYLAQFPGSASGYTYELLFPQAGLVGYTGGSLCLNSAPCGGYVSGSYTPFGEATANSSTLTLIGTPEPSSVLLLGTGLLGIAGAAKRRFFNA